MSALALAQPALPALAPVVIDRYAGLYAWLSNGAPSPVRLGRFTCATVEHGFNAAKTLDMAQRAWVIAAPAPFGRAPTASAGARRGAGTTSRCAPAGTRISPPSASGPGRPPCP